MNPPKHTPGPWKVIPTPTRKDTRFVIATENSAPLQAVLGTVDGASQAYYGKTGMVEANARIIAAAPDLLEALDGLSTAILSANDGWTLKAPHIQAWVTKAREAIAKAEGGE